MRSGDRLGCCNLALWDFLAIALLTGISVKGYYEIHTFYCILMGCAAGVISILLMRIKFLGALLQIACGLFWSQVIWRIGYHFHPTEDPVWIWGMQIVLAIICIALHFASVNEILGPKEDYVYEEIDLGQLEDRYAAVDLGEDRDEIRERFVQLRDAYLDACDERDEVMDQAQELLAEEGTDGLYRLMRENDRIWTEGSARMSVYVDMLQQAETYQEQQSAMKKAEKLLTRMQGITGEVMRESNQVLRGLNRRKSVEDREQRYQREEYSRTDEAHRQTSGDIDETLFAGCKDKESLTRRYRSLMKTFHPDNADGDTDMTVKVQKTYEALLQRY